MVCRQALAQVLPPTKVYDEQDAVAVVITM